MPTPYPDSEAALELATIDLFTCLGYSSTNCYGEWDSGKSTLARESKSEVILRFRLEPALHRLNPELSPEPLTRTIELIKEVGLNQ